LTGSPKHSMMPYMAQREHVTPDEFDEFMAEVKEVLDSYDDRLRQIESALSKVVRTPERKRLELPDTLTRVQPGSLASLSKRIGDK
jgi:hypothetical protein